MRTKPWTGTNRTAYDRVDDLTTLAVDYKGCRKVQHFIATDEALAPNPPACSCGNLVKPGDANRGMYDPKTKIARVQHYECAWLNLLDAIYNTPIPMEV